MSTFYKNLGNSAGIVIDKNDNMYVSDFFQINKFNLIGNRTSNFGKTNTISVAPTIQAIALDNKENVYFSDSKNKVVYKITKDGSSWSQYGGGFTNPNSICLDKYDNLYVVDGNIIKRFFPGNLTNFSGTATAGDNIGAASTAKFNNIRNILYKNDVIYIADKGNNKIKKLIL
jgi:sugar lactone lactonase YvrE